MLIDTHCHYNNHRLQADLADCLRRAEEAGVTRSIVIGYDMPSSEQAVALAEAHPGTLFAVVGVHPHDARHWNEEAAARLRELAEKPGVVAIGEIGLDFYHDFSPREDQYRAFRAQMALARELEMPVVIHCRDAYPETLEILEAEQVGTVGGVMHCWAGTVAEAQRTVSLGMKLGLGGTLTFKNAEEVRASACAVPAEALLVETDAPYLAPMPYRGKRNEPAYVRLVAEKLAELRSLSLEATAALTTVNAEQLFSRLTT
jgi:TatD DNase family protein